MIGSVKPWSAFDGERKYRCIIHNTCSDYPCLPCQIYNEVSKDYHAEINNEQPMLESEK